MPQSHRSQSLASRGKFPFRSTAHITVCAYEKQRLILSMAVKGIATKKLLDPVLISLPKGMHNTPPNGSHALAKGLQGAFILPSDSALWGHYSSPSLKGGTTYTQWLPRDSQRDYRRCSLFHWMVSIEVTIFQHAWPM